MLRKIYRTLHCGGHRPHSLLDMLWCFAAAGEQVSEEEESGVDEDFEPSAIVEEAKLDRRRSDKKKNSKLAKSCLPRSSVISFLKLLFCQCGMWNAFV